MTPSGSEAGTETSTGDGATLDGALDGAADAALDGESITDGGSNIDPDAGDDDAGPDAAICNMVSNDATPITSTCVSAAPVLGGGALVAGTYYLVAVADLGTKNFCATKFVPTGFKETLVLTVSAQGVGTAETHTNIAGGGSRRRTTTLTPGAGNTSPLQATSTCPVVGSAAAQYVTGGGAGGAGAKQELVLRLAYGKGEALYRFEKQ